MFGLVRVVGVCWGCWMHIGQPIPLSAADRSIHNRCLCIDITQTPMQMHLKHYCLSFVEFVLFHLLVFPFDVLLVCAELLWVSCLRCNHLCLDKRNTPPPGLEPGSLRCERCILVSSTFADAGHAVWFVLMMMVDDEWH